MTRYLCRIRPWDSACPFSATMVTKIVRRHRLALPWFGVHLLSSLFANAD